MARMADREDILAEEKRHRELRNLPTLVPPRKTMSGIRSNKLIPIRSKQSIIGRAKPPKNMPLPAVQSTILGRKPQAPLTARQLRLDDKRLDDRGAVAPSVVSSARVPTQQLRSDNMGAITEQDVGQYLAQNSLPTAASSDAGFPVTGPPVSLSDADFQQAGLYDQNAYLQQARQGDREIIDPMQIETGYDPSNLPGGIFGAQLGYLKAAQSLIGPAAMRKAQKAQGARALRQQKEQGISTAQQRNYELYLNRHLLDRTKYMDRVRKRMGKQGGAGGGGQGGGGQGGGVGQQLQTNAPPLSIQQQQGGIPITSELSQAFRPSSEQVDDMIWSLLHQSPALERQQGAMIRPQMPLLPKMQRLSKEERQLLGF